MTPLGLPTALAVTALAGAASALAPPLPPTFTAEMLPPIAELDGLTQVEIDAIIDRLQSITEIGDRHARIGDPIPARH